MFTSSILFLILYIQATSGLSLPALNVPAVVRANSSEVLLDCPYEFEDERDKHGLIVKWFVGSWRLVYQWIPEWRQQPQVAPFMEAKVDVSYDASSDDHKRKRALLIPRPDPSLSGVYTCKVSNYEADVARNASLLVWAPAEYVDLLYYRISQDLVNLSCSANKVAPKPEFTLYVVDPSGVRSGVETREGGSAERNGFFWTSHWGLLDYGAVLQDSIVGCSIYLPGTDHTKTVEKIYHSGLPIMTTTTPTVPPPGDEALRYPPSLANNVGRIQFKSLLDLESIIVSGRSGEFGSIILLHICMQIWMWTQY